MRAFIAVVVIVLAILIVFAVVRFIPPQKPTPPPSPVSRRAAPVQPAREVVTSYLGALYKKDYRAAYGLLSASSQKAHPFDEFVTLNDRGITQYDLATAKEEPGPAREAIVTLSLKEDVSQHSFRLAQEAGQWKIVYLKGTPSFPYAE